MPDSTPVERAGSIFIAIGGAIAIAAVIVMLWNVGFRPNSTPAGILWTLGGIGVAGFGVAVYGAILIDPARGSGALDKVTQTAGAVADRLPLRFGGRAAVVAPQADTVTTIDRSATGQPPVVVPPVGPPEVASAETPPEQAAASVAKRAGALFGGTVPAFPHKPIERRAVERETVGQQMLGNAIGSMRRVSEADVLKGDHMTRSQVVVVVEEAVAKALEAERTKAPAPAKRVRRRST
jgi:hypothetical protein